MLCTWQGRKLGVPKFEDALANDQDGQHSMGISATERRPLPPSGSATTYAAAPCLTAMCGDPLLKSHADLGLVAIVVMYC